MAIWPRANTHAVARAVGQRPVRWCMRFIDDTAARSNRRIEPRLDVLARDRDVDVHRVTQGLGLIELLHPDRRSMPHRVDSIVVGHRSVTEDGAPETDVNRIAFRCYGELYFLHGRTIRDCTAFTRNCRNGPRELDMPWFQTPDVAAQPNGYVSICES